MSTFSADWIHRLWKGEPGACGWYVAPPSATEDHAARRPDGEPLDGQSLAEWRDWLVVHDAPGATLENLHRLSDPRARTVVTGQQAGLFGGPLFTVVKAAAAIRWARRVESALSVPVVPVFWIASDDHDFAEVSTVRWLGSSGEVVSWSVSESPRDHGRAVFERHLSAHDYQQFRFRFLGSTPPSEYRDALVAQLDAAAGGEATWESQFTRLMLQWLGSEGLVPVVPRLGWLRRRAVPLMEREIREAPASARLLAAEGERLAGAGAKSHVLHRAGNEANFFVEREGIRCKVVREGAEFQLLHPVSGGDMGRTSEAELLALLGDSPGAFSPNVALRPLVQDLALPNVAYVGGPAEVIYHGQIGALYEHYSVFRPVVIPRPAVVAIEPRTERLAEKIGIPLIEAVRGGREAIRAAAARSADASDLRERIADRLASARAEVRRAMDLVQGETGDTGLRGALEKMSRGLETGCEKFDERLEHWLARRDEETAGQADRLSDALFPEGHAQERYVSALSPFFRVAGPDGARRLLERLDETEPAFQPVSIAPNSP